MRRLIVLAALAALLIVVPAFSQLTITPLQSSATANGDGAILSTAGMATIAFTVSCVGCSGATTISFLGTQDGANYAPIPAIQLGTSNIAFATNLAGVSLWEAPISGLQAVKTPVTNYGDGTVTVTASLASVAWAPRVTRATIAGPVDPMQPAVPVIVRSGVLVPPVLTQMQTGNPLLYRSAMQAYCALTLCPPWSAGVKQPF